jgi:MSHA pilin protein MshD
MNRRPQRGFTLIELIIFIVVVSIGMAGILTVMNTTVKSSADPMVRKQSIAIAEAMLEEISLKEYDNPTGGYTGSNRAEFDDVSDYDGYATSGGIVDLTGAVVAGLSSYNVAVAVAAESTATELTGVKAKKITVTVTGPAGTIALLGYRALY